MSQNRWDEYKELAAYIAAINKDTPYIPAEFPELRATVDQNTAPLPDELSESMAAEDHDEDWTMQQVESITTTAHDTQFAPVDHGTVPDRVVATTTNLPSAGSTAPSYDSLNSGIWDPPETPFQNGRADPSDAAGAFQDPTHDPQALPPFPNEAVSVHSTGVGGYSFPPPGDGALGELANNNFHYDSSHQNTSSQEDFIDTLVAADILQSMPTGSNPFHHSSNLPTTGIADTGFTFGNGLLANTSFDFDYDFDADIDAFLRAPNLAAYMASRQEPSSDGFASSRDADMDVGMGATMDPADLHHNNNNNHNNNNINNNGAAFTPLAYAHQQENHGNHNHITATSSPIDLFLKRESPFIFGNTANRPTTFAPSVTLPPPTPFTPVNRPSLKRRRSLDSSSISPTTSSPTLPPNRRRRTNRRPAPAPAPGPLPTPTLSLPLCPLSTSIELPTLTRSTRVSRFLQETGMLPGALADVLRYFEDNPLLPGVERRYKDGMVMVVEAVEGVGRKEIRVRVEG